ncbi:MAG: hypothetical protein ACLFNQ_00265 [Spirochaetaceae bacterium]
MSTHIQENTQTHHAPRDEAMITGLRRQGVDFSHEEAWATAQEHVQVHRFFLGQDTGRPVSSDEGASSWKLNVFGPIFDAMRQYNTGFFFPRTDRDTLHMRISDHWFFLKTNDPTVTADQAVVDYMRRFGSPLTRLAAAVLYGRENSRIQDRVATSDTIDQRVMDMRSSVYADARNWPVGQ